MSTPPYVAESLAIRSSHPKAPAREVLDLVMQGHTTAADAALASWLEPSQPFAALVCEAFDTVMVIDEWRIMTAPQQEHREALLEVWRSQVVARFLARYSAAADIELPMSEPCSSSVEFPVKIRSL